MGQGFVRWKPTLDSNELLHHSNLRILGVQSSMASLHLQHKSSLLNTFICLSQAISSQGILTDGLLHQGHIKQTVDAPADKILQRTALQYRQWNGRDDRFVTSTGTSKNTVNPSIISSQNLVCSLLKLSVCT
ncbi:hypothetical protein E4U46_007742 [Claviceps purpurea]|nr:hypothetical protein E4U36_006573 [Claviceps purpurea]KAG6253718.1 hypothetical protein E4U23_007301 [Claviceps purpurea]KAG6283554.1 hypothetical protein E4U46_007742 [Claviceps purpurea]